MDPKLFDKMQKVLALVKGGDEHEAATAAAILEKMLLEHNLSIADLEKKGAVAAQSATEKSHDLGKAAFRWKLDLAETIARHYFCHPLIGPKSVSFVGRPDNVESLTMLYGWVIDQIKRIAADERRKHCEANPGDHVDPLRWQVNFGIGAVERLGHRLDEEKARSQAEMARNEVGDVVALTISRNTEISDYLEKTRGYRVDDRETQWQRERREKREAEAKAKAEWLARDPRGYYERYPNEHPDRVKLLGEAREKEWAAWQKKEARNARRRANYSPRGFGRGRAWNPEDDRKAEQAETATRAGRAAADRINLRPFLEGSVPADESKRIGKERGE